MRIHRPLALDGVPHWGLCPDCHTPPTIVNYYKLNVATCSNCKTAWTVGYNLVGRPTHADEAETVGAELRGYRKVEPYYPLTLMEAG